MKETRENKVRRAVEARSAFRAMLESTASLTSRSKYQDAELLLHDDERWTALEKGERESELRQFLQFLSQREREVGSHRRFLSLGRACSVRRGITSIPRAAQVDGSTRRGSLE